MKRDKTTNQQLEEDLEDDTQPRVIIREVIRQEVKDVSKTKGWMKHFTGPLYYAAIAGIILIISKGYGFIYPDGTYHAASVLIARIARFAMIVLAYTNLITDTYRKIHEGERDPEPIRTFLSVGMTLVLLLALNRINAVTLALSITGGLTTRYFLRERVEKRSRHHRSSLSGLVQEDD